MRKVLLLAAAVALGALAGCDDGYGKKTEKADAPPPAKKTGTGY